MVDKGKVLAGRVAVEAYREAHTRLYDEGWHKGIPDEHTPLLNTMLTEFKKQGFNSLQEFFDASELLNIQELGFTSREDIKTEAHREALALKWS